MKRHLCRHCGLAVDTYAELKRHVESHSIPSEHSYSIAPPSDLENHPTPSEHSYSIAPPSDLDNHPTPSEHSYSIAPPSDLAKKTKYSCKCKETFTRWDNLHRHVRTACRFTATAYTCTKCGKNFKTRNNLQRHVRTACLLKKRPPHTRVRNAERIARHTTD